MVIRAFMLRLQFKSLILNSCVKLDTEIRTTSSDVEVSIFNNLMYD